MLHIGIVGAGIGGLTAGLALARAGCRVSVFERTPMLAELGAGLQLSPNATRVLRSLGVLAEVERQAVTPLSIRIGRGSDGKRLASLPLGPEAEHRFGAPFLVTWRADLHRVLHEALRDAPNVTIETGKRLVDWRVAGKGLALRFAGHEAWSETVDALVGCDGLHSLVRERLGLAGPAQHGGQTAWRATIEASAAPDWVRAPNTHLWLGPKAHLVHYPVAAGRLINVIAATDEVRSDHQEGAFWSTPGDPAEIRARFASWAEPIQRLVGVPAAWGKWPLADRKPLRYWSQGAVTLLGDAAHPMLPFLAQGAAQAIEDAAALAAAVVAQPLDPAAAFRAYETARLGRTARIQAESRRQAAIYHLPFPLSALRDVALRLTPPGRLLARYDWVYAPPG